MDDDSPLRWPHPGEILKECLDDLGIPAARLSRATRIPYGHVRGIIAGRRNVTADAALRIGKALGTTPEYWLGLQQTYDLRQAKHISMDDVEVLVAHNINLNPITVADIPFGMRTVTLNQEEIRTLDGQDPRTEADGGFQSLLVRLQRALKRQTGELQLQDKDLEQIPRYAFDYRNGGWQNMLVAIFGRTLGKRLGR